MDLYAIGLGAFFMLLGVLIKKFPNLMAGYNTMTKEQKQNVDTEGLTSFARKVFMLMGVAIIITFYALSTFGYQDHFSNVITGIIIVGVAALLIGAQKFDNN